MAPSRRMLVEERAGHRCEYCLMPISGDVQPFQLDHVRAQKHSGVSSPANLAWSCLPRITQTFCSEDSEGWTH